MPAPRSKTTCYQCRARKVRCDGGPDRCTACERLNFRCSFEATSLAPVSSPTSQPQRQRGAQACTECRSQKIKCSSDLPVCTGCRRRGRECLYADSRRKKSCTERERSGRLITGPPDAFDGASAIESSASQENATEIASTVSSNNPGIAPQAPPPAHDQLRLIGDFFRHLYPIALCSFLNEQSIIQRCQGGTLDETLTLAICAVAASRLGNRDYFPHSISSWTRIAESRIWSHLEHPTIFRTQALLLICQYHIETGEFQKAFMLSSIASRAASALRLHYERIDIHPLAQEVRRRLMWSLILMDGQFSSGLPECELCPYENVYLKLPCPEEEFVALNDSDKTVGSSSTQDSMPEDGLLSLIVRQAALRRDISRLKRQMALSGQPVPQIEALVNSFERSLEELRIPAYRSETLRAYSSSRWLGRFVVAHLSWHQCHCDLYRLFISGYAEAAPDVVIGAVSTDFINKAAIECFDHARGIIQILQDLAKIRLDMKVVDIDIAICSYHASRIVLFFSEFPLRPHNSGFTKKSALSEAESTLDFLRRLYKNSTLAKFILVDLEKVIRPKAPAIPSSDRVQEAPEERYNTQTSRPRFARIAKRHQNLAVHSILRQARFVDDSQIAAGPLQVQHNDSTRISTRGDKLIPAMDIDAGSGDSPSIERRVPEIGVEQREFAPKATEGIENPSLVYPNDSPTSHLWGNWNETWGLNEWPMASDDNYF